MGFVILGVLVLAVIFGVIWGARGDRPGNGGYSGTVDNASDTLMSIVIVDTLGDAVESIIDSID